MLNHHQLTESSKIIFGSQTLNTHNLLNNTPIHTIFRLESPGEQDLQESSNEFQK
jgi:hypothetical protein